EGCNATAALSPIRDSRDCLLIRREKFHRQCYLRASSTRKSPRVIAPPLTTSVMWASAGIFAVLAVATARTSTLAGWRPQRGYRGLLARVWSWWLMIGVFAVALLLGRLAMLIFFGLVSFLALKEYLSVIPTRRADRRVLLWAYLAIPLQYYWVGAEW